MRRRRGSRSISTTRRFPLHPLTSPYIEQAWLSLYLDHETVPALALPLNLSDSLGLGAHQGRAWVGFTAATGVASMDADLLSFAFAQYV